MPAEVVTELVSAGCRFCFIVHNQIDNRHDIGKEDSKYRFSISALNKKNADMLIDKPEGKIKNMNRKSAFLK